MTPAARLSDRSLMQAQEFLLEVHGCHEPAGLRTCITSGLGRLIACDRTSFNEADLSPGLKHIVPTPTPSWWPRFGEVYIRHMLEHPALSRDRCPPLLHTIALSDAPHGRAWEKSTLRNEYFVPLDVTHQLSARIHETGHRRDIISLNRHRRGFSAQERALVDLFNPHLAQAWRNAQLFAALHEQLATAETDPDAGVAAVAVNPSDGTLRSLSPAAARLLRRYFSTDATGRIRAPDDLSRWLQAQRTRHAAAGPSVPLVIRQPGRHLVVDLARQQPEEVLLLLRDCRPAPAGRSAQALDRLSPREREILEWVSEGKRNSEIAVILSISPRTVEKHMEHILVKLGVETRSAAIRQAAAKRASRAS